MSPHDRAAAVGDFTPSGTGAGHLLDATDARMYAAAHLLLDARPADRFRGENETVDPLAGHIPGAVNVSALGNVDREGRFLSAAALAATSRSETQRLRVSPPELRYRSGSRCAAAPWRPRSRGLWAESMSPSRPAAVVWPPPPRLRRARRRQRWPPTAWRHHSPCGRTAAQQHRPRRESRVARSCAGF